MLSVETKKIGDLINVMLGDIVIYYAINFYQRASMANIMAFRMNNEEDVRVMAERVSNMNRYYGINLKKLQLIEHQPLNSDILMDHLIKNKFRQI